MAADPSSILAQQALWSYWEDIISRYWGRPATIDEVDAALRGYPSDDLVPPDNLLVVAVAEQEHVGCGGVRLLPCGIAELTRIHVAVSMRRRGLGARIVQRLERHARDHERSRARLDVRGDLIEARALYATLGYREVPRFNDHHFVQHWFEKTL
ncbi:MAG: GNAT family N-acetyltransferase [Solirubrobacteraceae bacterium]